MFVPPLLLTALCVTIALRSPHDRLLTGWLLWSGVIHIFMELSYAFFPEVVQGRSTISFSEFMTQPTTVFGFLDPHWWANIYNQYARYDGRYVEHDPVLLLITQAELFMGPACFLLVVLIAKRSPWRHPTQITLGTAQAYGTFIYFLMPVYRGNWSTTMTQDTFELWIYVIILNGLWIAVPSLMVVQSFRAIVRRFRHPRDGSNK